MDANCLQDFLLEIDYSGQNGPQSLLNTYNTDSDETDMIKDEWDLMCLNEDYIICF